MILNCERQEQDDIPKNPLQTLTAYMMAHLWHINPQYLNSCRSKKERVIGISVIAYKTSLMAVKQKGAISN